MTGRELSELIVGASLRAADPGAAVARAWPAGLGEGPVVLVSVGKASVAMATAAGRMLGNRLVRGVVVGPRGTVERWEAPPGIVALGADHPIATDANVRAARQVGAVASSCSRDEILLTLISGGASAYLTLPADGLRLADIASVTGDLLRAGAPIEALNCVRKHCEIFKGGGLARAGSGGAAHWSLVLSDVLGDPLDAIGSGPTAADPTTFSDALRVLDEFTPRGHAAVRRHLEIGVRGGVGETLKPRDTGAGRVRHVVVANNAVAVDGVAASMRERGVSVEEVRGGVRGEAADVGRALAERLRSLSAGPGASCVVWGGETTVTVGDAAGVGGRNQELALSAGERIAGIDGAVVIAFATDGVDGPTDAAGAWVDGRSWGRIRDAGVDPGDALRRHDSHRALGTIGALIRTGVTGTNVNDVAVGVLGVGG